MKSEIARQKMLEQLKQRGIKSERVLAAFGRLRREHFVLAEYQENAYADYPLPIGLGQTISQPYIAALMTQALNLQPGEKVLEIGTGSGYQAAILSLLGVRVYSIERLLPLAERAKAAWQKEGLKIDLKVGDGSLGWQEQSPFDAIMVTAACTFLPPPLISQLKEGGRIIMPKGGLVFQDLVLGKKIQGAIKEETICKCVFVPLVGEYGLKK